MVSKSKGQGKVKLIYVANINKLGIDGGHDSYGILLSDIVSSVEVYAVV